MIPVKNYQESRVTYPGCFYQMIFQKMGCFVWGDRNDMGCLVGMTNVLSGMPKTAWDVFQRWQIFVVCFVRDGKKMVWDILSLDVLSSSQGQINFS